MMFVSRLILLLLLVLGASSCAFAQGNVGAPVSVPPPIVVDKPVPQVLETGEVKIITQQGDEFVFNAEIADEAEERRIGMMYRREVPENTGMLFIVEDEAERKFWMKNTYVPLDLLFIRQDGIIHNIAHNADPGSLSLLESHGAVKAVLEIGGNVAAEKNINVGDRGI